MVFASHTAFATIYKWQDGQGNVHFSDKAHKGAKSITLPKLQTYTPEKIPEKTGAFNPVAKKPMTLLSHYQALSIVQPKHDQAIRSNNGSLTIKVRTTPAMQTEDLLEVYLDGTRQGEPAHTLVVNVQNIDRGTHKLKAQIVDGKGNVLVESNDVTFHLLRHSASLKKAVISSKNGRSLEAYS